MTLSLFLDKVMMNLTSSSLDNFKLLKLIITLKKKNVYPISLLPFTFTYLFIFYIMFNDYMTFVFFYFFFGLKIHPKLILLLL